MLLIISHEHAISRRDPRSNVIINSKVVREKKRCQTTIYSKINYWCNYIMQMICDNDMVE